MSRGRRRLLALLAALALAGPMPARGAVTLTRQEGRGRGEVRVCGLAQLEMRRGRDTSAGGGLSFRAQRLRLGFYYVRGPIAANLAVDVAKDHAKVVAGMPAMIKCAFVGYRLGRSTVVRLELVKTPVGMKYSLPGWNMAIVERNRLDKGLVLERDTGLLVSWSRNGPGNAGKDMRLRGTRGSHGFGVDVGVFNPAGRAAAVRRDDRLRGGALACAARARWDRGAPLHVEASWGVSEQAGGPGTADYRVVDVGVASTLVRGRLRLDLEFVRGRNLLDIDGFDQRCLTVSASYMFAPRVEGVIRHYAAAVSRDDDPAVPDSDLGNTYLGINFYLSPLAQDHRTLQSHRIQVNWVLASGDDGEAWTGRWGYRHDALVVQWQLRF